MITRQKIWPEVDLSSLQGKVGIFGGTFDPITRSHTVAALAALTSAQLDCVVLIPAHQNPLKGESPLASDKHRMMMLKLALKEEAEKKLLMSDIELKREGKSYTIDTLRTFLKESSQSSLSLIVGSDILPGLERWKDSHQLIQSLERIICLERDSFSEQDIDKLPFDKKVKRMLRANYLAGLELPGSSSEVRKLLRESPETARNLLHDTVFEYIKDHGLYGPKLST